MNICRLVVDDSSTGDSGSEKDLPDSTLTKSKRRTKKKKKVSCELVFYFISQMPSKESEAPVIIFSVDIISDDDGENLITMMMLMIQ